MIDQLKLIISKAQQSHVTNKDVKLPNLKEDI